MPAAGDKILVVDDESFIRMALGEALRSWNYKSVEAATVKDALKVFAEEDPGLVLLDIDLPDGNGLDVLKQIKEQNPETIVIMITGNVSVPNAVTALRGGAYDFIGKPLRLEELRVTLRNALETKQLRREVKATRREKLNNFNFSQIIGESSAIVKAKNLAQKVAESDASSILLQGESGTGKDLFARAIHHGSARADAPYVAINCAALPANLIESELFGYEKGAFTDAKTKKEGLFEQAQGGTLFLDEIGELDIALQAKLLRVLEENTFRRVGGLRDLLLDARVIAASNRDLKRESAEQNFRLDLYYRLSVIQIDIPPLRERKGDILLLAQYYIDKNNRKRTNNQLRGLAAETEKIFLKYNWAGNVRELRNIIERASILEDGELVTTEFLPADLVDGYSFPTHGSSSNPGFILPVEGIPLEDVELQLAQQAVERTNGNLTHAAKLLHISRDQLRYKLKKKVG
jgi:two-component system, NtrC family, response regulator AtoC